MKHLNRGRVCTNWPSMVGSRILLLKTGASMVRPCSGLQKPLVSQSVRASWMPSSSSRAKMLWYWYQNPLVHHQHVMYHRDTLHYWKHSCTRP